MKLKKTIGKMLFNNYNTLVPQKYLMFVQCIVQTFIYV